MQKQYNRVGGAIGEFDASEYLKSKKYEIVKVNYYNYLGEIDIIAMKKKLVVFVEVKRRSTLKFGRPSEAVDFKKQQKIKNVAQLYLLQNHMADSPCRFDVIEVLGDEINHIENAFYLSGLKARGTGAEVAKF